MPKILDNFDQYKKYQAKMKASNFMALRIKYVWRHKQDKLLGDHIKRLHNRIRQVLTVVSFRHDSLVDQAKSVVVSYLWKQLMITTAQAGVQKVYRAMVKINDFIGRCVEMARKRNETLRDLAEEKELENFIEFYRNDEYDEIYDKKVNRTMLARVGKNNFCRTDERRKFVF